MLKPKTKHLGLAAALSVLFCMPLQANVRFAGGINIGALFRAGKQKLAGYINPKTAPKIADMDKVKGLYNKLFFNTDNPGANATKVAEGNIFTSVTGADGGVNAFGQVGAARPGAGRTDHGLLNRDIGVVPFNHAPAPAANCVRIDNVTVANAAATLDGTYFGGVKDAAGTAMTSDILKMAVIGVDVDKYLSTVEDYEFEPELTSWARAIRLEANVLAQWEIAKTPLSIGLIGRIGYSFQEYKDKDEKDNKGFKDSRGFYAALGLVMGITEYAEVQFGIGTARHKTEVDLAPFKTQLNANTAIAREINKQADAMYKTLTGAVKNCVTDAGGKTAVDNYAKDFAALSQMSEAIGSLADKFTSSSVTRFQMFLFASIGVNIPIIRDSLYLIASIGVEKDLINSESKDEFINKTKLKVKGYPTGFPVAFGFRMKF